MSYKILNLVPRTLHCHALNEKIMITRSFVNHLINKKSRTKKQTKLRIKHIPQGLEILENINYYQKSRITKNTSGNIHFYSLQAVVCKKIVEVVIRQIGNTPKQLFSIVYKGKSPL